MRDNLISGNDGEGIYVLQSSDNVIEGNLLGTDVTGSLALGNGADGIRLKGGTGDTVGGTTPAARNIISGNEQFNVYLVGSAGETVEGNYIGTDETGSFALSSTLTVGVQVLSSSDNTIGGTAAGAGNVISGNGNSGVSVGDYNFLDPTTTAGNVIQGNLIGLNADGTAAVPNGFEGVTVQVAEDTEIGGTAPGAGNDIAGTANDVSPGLDEPPGADGVGILVVDNTPGTVIEDNFIGTDKAGTAAVPNQGSGIELQTAAATITGNVISGNDDGGVTVYGNEAPAGLSGLWTADDTAYDDFYDDGTLNGGAHIRPGPLRAGLLLRRRQRLLPGQFPLLAALRPDRLLRWRHDGSLDQDHVARRHDHDRRRRGRHPERHGPVPPERPARRLRQQGDGRPVQLRAHRPRHARRRPVAPRRRHLGWDDERQRRDALCQRRRGGDRHRAGHPRKFHRLRRQLAPLFWRRPEPAGALLSGPDGRGRRLQPGPRRVRDRHHLQPPRPRPDDGAATITDNTIGLDNAGSSALANGNDGVFLDNSSFDTIGGTTAGVANVIAGNTADGVEISGAASTADLVAGDWIGTLEGGESAAANDDGVLIDDDASGNTIGGTTATALDVISGNTADGVAIDSGATGNVVEGDLIGIDDAGTTALANEYGVELGDDATGNMIGGTSSGDRDIISGNTQYGVYIDGTDAGGNTIEGDDIGTDTTGTSAVSNHFGIFEGPAAGGNTIGGVTATPGTGPGNVISGNIWDGMELYGEGNLIEGNTVGTDASGTNPLPNAFEIDPGASDGGIVLLGNGNTVGGVTSTPGTGAGNLISANDGDYGLAVSSSGNLIEGNEVGTNLAGSAALGNQGIGIALGATLNTVGGTTAGAGNLVSGNGSMGILVWGGGPDVEEQELIAGNEIGTNLAGTAAVPNANFGIEIYQSAGTTIGGTASSARNIISGNAGWGVYIYGDGSSANLVIGNFIGTNSTGDAAIGNTSGGIIVGYSPLGTSTGNTIGGLTATPGTGAGNVISGNGQYGVLSAATDCVIAGNLIGTNADGTAAIPNVRGIDLDGATDSTIGGTAAGARNIISGNTEVGVEVENDGARAPSRATSLRGTLSAPTSPETPRSATPPACTSSTRWATRSVA